MAMYTERGGIIINPLKETEKRGTRDFVIPV